MEQTWRWFGPNDKVALPEIRQAGAEGIVTALHEIPYGVAWSLEAIRERQALLADMPWSVVESLPVSEKIKLGEPGLDEIFENYRISIRNLAACGVRTICYNFMTVIDWTRTELGHVLPSGAKALRFNAAQSAAFDCYILERPGAEDDYAPALLDKARAWMKGASEADRATLLASIMAGLPGAYDRYDVPALKKLVARYREIGRADLVAHHARFLREVVPAAEECGVRLAIHPDDPPFDIFGLPRIVSRAEDLQTILDHVPSPANGLTFCTGALGAGAHNDVPALARRFAPHIHFVHLRNVAKEPDGSFMESDHLGGDVDMVAVVRTLLAEQARRMDEGHERWRIPFRPDHGHEIADDLRRGAFPGYPLIGRLRGLAEIRGVMKAVAQLEGLPA